ncbi:MAG: UDP-N-acetylmuramoyl-L-alanyl-D-glutamate--2,6-diaminopimelate ligase [Actinobacteria bacterium ADurb.BinA094]|nr:MAG: UDP-N-acetylmuramoyl-L-alanyl-D-glutamate--2,6-diaminopimelate ligase [Actinobacteria bacterium ADurb.BinA094]
MTEPPERGAEDPASLVESVPMKLSELLEGVADVTVRGDPDTEIRGLACHTRDVADGTLFFCVPGLTFDGHDFAAAAVRAGAAAVVCAREAGVSVPQVVAPSVRRALASVAARWYGHPSRELTVAGVTGTNGKTTTAYLLAGVLAAAGRPSGLLGTVANRIGGVEHPVKLTTAESLDLQRMFREMATAGDAACVLEVSSHALVQDRAAGIDFDVVVFSNLTRDHLDYHRDLEDYFGAKRRLFLPDGVRNGHALAVVNVGDEFGARLAHECAPQYGADLWTYAVADDAGPGVTVAARDLHLSADGSTFTLECPRLALRAPVRLRLAARFNVENALAAATAGLALGLPPEAVVRGLAATGSVPGRFEAVRAGQPFGVLVDYSHTPDSLENALEAARAVTPGRLLVVFGCGGDRDRGKRPLMGALGARLADRSIVTSDNPRSEDPLAIIDEIVAGVPAESAGRVVVEPDRRRAIRMALGEAVAGDTVLIAGKGHEQGQTIGDDVIPFDDRTVAAEELARLREMRSLS